MAFDTRAYAKYLKKAGIKRKHARAHVEAMSRYLPPDLATKTDIAAIEQATNADLLALDRRLASLEALPIQNTQMQALGIIAAALGILFALLKLTENGHGQRPEQRRIASGL